MEILRICLEEQPLIKYYVAKHLILLKTRNMMDINVDFLVYKFFDKKSGDSGVISEVIPNQELAVKLH